MFTKPRLAPLLMLPVLALFSAIASARAADQDDRIAASFVLALGRAPAASELASWTAFGEQSVAELLARHRQQLQHDAALERVVAIKAWQDAFGHAPADGEITPVPGDKTYTELMKRHVRRLDEGPADYARVIHRAYQLLVRREAYPEELDYWKRHGALPYAVLVGCIEDWARRNQPGLMVTTGTARVSVNSNYLTTVVLSPELAAETRAAADLAPSDNAAFVSAAGRNLIAVGAANVVTGGHLHFVAAGGPYLTANLQPGTVSAER